MPVCGESLRDAGVYQLHTEYFPCTYVYPARYDDHREPDVILAKLRPLFCTDASQAGTHPYKKRQLCTIGVQSPPTENGGYTQLQQTQQQICQFWCKVATRCDVGSYVNRSSKGARCATLVEQHSKVKRVISKRYSTVRCSLRSGRAFVSRWFVYIAINTCNPTALIRLIDLVEHY